MSHEPGEGPVTAEEAKARVKAWKDEHKPKPGDDERTRNDRLDDPAKSEGDE